jgi:hypothetical protein
MWLAFRKMDFYLRFDAEMLVLEELTVEALESGSSVSGVGELYRAILEYYTMCLYRDCRICDGVACEEAIGIEVKDRYPNATAIWKAWDLKAEPSSMACAEWAEADRGILPN